MNKIKINKVKGELKKFGYVRPEQDDSSFVLGALGQSLPQSVLKEDGQWDNWLPVYEPQFNDIFDTYGCTVWGSLNAIEIYIKRLTNFERNFAERFIYILADVRPPGANPHHVLETIRKNGLIDEKLLPMTPEQDFIKFTTPNPMSKKLLEEGMKFEYEVKHEYLWNPWLPISKEERTKLIKNALRFSPIQISVTAWFENEQGIYVDMNRPNTHWCVCFGWTAKGWKVFDSYDQSVKIVSFDHYFDIAKRIHLLPNNYLPRISLIQRALDYMAQLLALLFKQQEEQKEEIVTGPTLESEPVPEPKESLLIPWAKAIEKFENANKSWNNPGAIRSVSGPFLRFKTYEEGFNYLLNYLTRAASGKHKAYPRGGETTLLEFQHIYSPAEDNNNPEAYANFVAKEIGVTTDTKIKSLV